MIYKNIYHNKISIIGLGYVGLPIALAFSKKFKVIGFDLDKEKIKNLKKNKDINNEISSKEIKNSKNITFSNDLKLIKDSNIYIITVPTPLKINKLPDLTLLKNATKMVAKFLKPKDIVIYESTVYPGVTEQVCVPILKKYSNLKYINYNNEKKLKKNGFYCGYSPERINPGDKKNNLNNIIKITSGSSNKASVFVDKIYNLIIRAGTYRVSSIKIAEAAKIIENTQRDINIALINELSIIFNKLKLNTNEILDAACTKWNFLNFRPGLVGGHCISVDPYYLTYKSKRLGYNPKVILSGRLVNDKMPEYISKVIVTDLKKNKSKVKKILILGATFKENCSDLRNSKVVDMYKILKSKKFNIDVYERLAIKKDFKKIFKKNQVKKLVVNNYDAIIIAVKHNYIKEIGINTIKKLLKKDGLIYDLKQVFPNKHSKFQL